ncbi:hypothetical protein AGMMS50230_08190 [Spirochaetia bacterium]|nr:hypothetical protein AGMMS50230_08190 [Spirochaetia bacterium]
MERYATQQLVRFFEVSGKQENEMIHSFAVSVLDLIRIVIETAMINAIQNISSPIY